MDTETKAHKLPAIRTYAKDLDTTRSAKPAAPAAPSSAVVDTPTPVVEAPARASDTLTAEVSKIVVPVVAKAIPSKAPAVPALKPLAPTKKDPTIIVENEDAAAATIITDTKRGEFKLFPAIINSIRGWFSAKKQDYAAKKIPKYTVPDSTRRKGIIQKATSKTGKFASSDFSSIQERILERKAAAAKAEELPPEPSTIWTANTEPGFPLLPETTPTAPISNVQVVPRKTFRATPEQIVIPKPEPIAIPLPPPIPEVEEDNRWATPVQAVAPVIEKPAVAALDEVPEFEPIPTTETIVPEVVTEPEIIEPAPTPLTEQAPVKKSGFDFLKTNTNALTVYVAGFVVLLAALGTTGYFMLYKETTVPRGTTLPDTLLLGTEIKPLLLYNISKESLIEGFVSLQNERGTTEGVYLYTSTIGSTNPVVPTDILAALGITVASDFAQTISTIRVGYINQAPYLLLDIKDETAAKGGLLMWEETMYNDLSALLFLAPETTDTFFDATISGSDVRVLKNASGAERLLYGIVSGTIVVTTNSASYAQLTSLLE